MSTIVGPLRFAVLQATASCAQHPSVTITAPSGWKILGGGAFVNWDGPPPSPVGNLLTGVFPNEDGTTWTATSKDHLRPSPANIVAYCIIAQMEDGSSFPDNAYKIVSATSKKANHPTLTVRLPDEFAVVGGGARANYAGLGSMLYATHPGDWHTWIGAAKDHLEQDPSTITVWAIGLNIPFLYRAELLVRIFQNTSSPLASHPHVIAEVPTATGEYHITGGGARTNWDVGTPLSLGNMLTASYPGGNQTWIADGKDHIQPDPCTITAWALVMYKYN